MRAAYKRELKKVQDSKGTGAGLKDVYIPTLWYFEYLTFLDHKETLNRSGVDTLGICGDDEVSETQSLISEPSNPSAIKRRATNFQKKQEKLIECAQQLMSTEDGPAESYGRAIGLQLKDMNRTQQCIAEKLISEMWNMSNINCSCGFCISKSKCPQQQQSWLEETVAAVVEKYMAKLLPVYKPQPSRVTNVLKCYVCHKVGHKMLPLVGYGRDVIPAAAEVKVSISPQGEYNVATPKGGESSYSQK